MILTGAIPWGHVLFANKHSNLECALRHKNKFIRHIDVRARRQQSAWGASIPEFPFHA
jgi:hypothetical protein